MVSKQLITVSCSRSRTPSGFTLIEMLVVMSIIAAIMAMVLPAMTAIGERTNERRTQGFINAVAAAIAADSRQTMSLGGKTYQMWYLSGNTASNADGYLDGNPLLDTPDPSFASLLEDPAIAAALDERQYRGPAAMLTMDIPPRHVDRDTGRLIDAWGHPLRVLDVSVEEEFSPYHGNETLRRLAGTSGLGIWSSGPNNDPLNRDDNVTSWSSGEQ